MSNQILISSGAKLRDLDDVIIGTDGVLTSLGFNVANGVPKLDENGKILVSQLPNSVMEFKGVWNAATNTPTLADGTGNAGDVYLCNVAGTVNFGSGPIAFAVGDYAVYTGTVWARSSGATGTVTSVGLSRSGDALTVTGSPITTSGTINIGFAGTNTQYINGAGNLVTFPTIATEAQRLITEVYNRTGATLTKGTIVYINGGQGNLPSVTKAIATGDSTSAQTYGIVQNDISNMNNGFVVVIGSLTDLDTQAYPEGTQLYLSGTTAGTWTSTKPYAPVHLVYVAIVTRSHPTQGVVEVSIQNGYEMDELHNVAAQNPDNNDILQYKTSTSLWTKVAGTTSNIAEGSNLYFTNARARQSISLTTTGSTGAATYDNTTGVLNIPNYVDQYVGTVTSVGLSAPTGFSVTGSPVTSSGTLALSFASGYSLPTNVKQSNWDDAYTWVAAFPTQTGNSGKFLTTDGSSLSWAANPLGTVTSVAMSVPTGLTVTGSPITSAGTLAVTFTAGYSIPTNASQTNWDTAYTNRITSLTTTGSSGAATLISNTLNVPNYTLAGLGGVPTTRTLTINGLTQDLSADRTWTITAGISSVSGTAPISVSTVGGAATVSIATANTTTTGALTSTDWNTFNGKQNALTNPVTGTGTLNYVAKFTATGSTIGSSSIFDNGTRVGIFTNTPTDTFTVSGNGAILSERFTGANPYSGDLYFYSARGTAGSPTVKVNGDVAMGIRARSYDGTTYIDNASIESYVTGVPSTNVMFGDLRFSTNNGNSTPSVKMTLTASGRLGIGIVDPSESLQVIGRVLASGYFNSNDGTRDMYMNPAANFGFGALPSIQVVSNHALQFATNNSLRMTVSNDGNLLVNTATNAGFRLDVNGTGRFTGQLNGNIGVNVGANALGSDRMFQISGTSFTSGGSQFAAVINPSFSGTITNVFGVYAGNNFNTGTITNSFNLYIEGTSLGSATVTNRFGIYQAGGTDRNYFAGNLSIGDVANRSRLLVVGTGGSQGETVQIYNTSANNAFKNTVNIGDDRIGDWGLLLGKSGINTPNTGYHAPNGAHIVNVQDGPIRFGTNNTQRVEFASDGKVLIGTTGLTGAGLLQVNGNVNINGVFQINGVTIGGGGGSGVTGSGTANNLTKWTGSSTLGNSGIIDNGTNINFGTNDIRLGPDVSGSNTGIIKWQGGAAGIPNSIGIFTWADAKDIQIGGANVYFRSEGGTQRLLITSSGAIEVRGNAAFGLATSATQYTSISENQIWRTGNGDFYVNWSGGTGSTIIGSAGSGNVLIGTTSNNGYKFQLNGSASYAFGFLHIYRGSSSPNDILVGNSGSVFYIGGNTQVVGSVSASGGFFDTSDARLKTLVEDNYLLSSIANVKAKLYIKDGRKELGYYAQDLEAILPSAVKEGSDGFLSLSYAQVHTAKIAVIEDEVTILKNRVSELEKQLNLN